MQAVLAGGSVGSDQSAEDEQHLVWCFWFFLAFTRHFLTARRSARGDALAARLAVVRSDALLDTLSVQTFHQLYSLINAYLDNLVIDKAHGDVNTLNAVNTDSISRPQVVFARGAGAGCSARAAALRGVG